MVNAKQNFDPLIMEPVSSKSATDSDTARWPLIPDPLFYSFAVFVFSLSSASLAFFACGPFGKTFR